MGTKKQYFVLVILMVSLSIFLGGCYRSYTYKGVVVDFFSKEAISDARLHYLSGNFEYTDQLGQFWFQSDGRTLSSGHLNLTSIKAENYAHLYNVQIMPNIDTTIPLVPSRSVYGVLQCDKPQKYSLTIEGEGYSATATPDEKGEFCFAAPPVNEMLTIYFYQDQQKSSVSYPVCIYEENESRYCVFDSSYLRFE